MKITKGPSFVLIWLIILLLTSHSWGQQQTLGYYLRTATFEEFSVQGIPLALQSKGSTSEFTVDLEFHPVEETKIITGQKTNIVISDAETNYLITEKFISLPLEYTFLNSFVFSPTGDLLATSTISKEIYIWEWDKIKEATFVSSNAKINEFHTAHAVTAMAFTSNGLWLAAGTKKGMLTIWNTFLGEKIFESRYASDPIQALAFSPDNQFLAFSIKEGGIRILDVSSFEIVSSFTTGEENVRTIVFSPNNKWLFIVDGEDIKVLEVGTWRLHTTLRWHDKKITDLAVSPDGRWLFSAGRDRAVVVWDTYSWEPVGYITDFVFAIRHIAINSAGTLLAVYLADGKTYVFDITSLHFKKYKPDVKNEPFVHYKCLNTISSDRVKFIPLTTAFLADSILKAYNAKQKLIQVEQGEFESSTAYEKRMKKASEWVCEFWKGILQEAPKLVVNKLKQTCQLRLIPFSKVQVDKYIPDYETLIVKINGKPVAFPIPYMKVEEIVSNKENIEVFGVFGDWWNTNSLVGYALRYKDEIYISHDRRPFPFKRHPCLTPSQIKNLLEGKLVVSNPSSLPPLLKITNVSIVEEHQDGIIYPFEKANLNVVVENIGKGPAINTYITSEKQVGIYLDSFAVRKTILPGAKDSFLVPLKVEPIFDQHQLIRLKIYAVSGNVRTKKPKVITFKVAPYFKPDIKVQHVQVKELSNPNNTLEVGEEIEVSINVSNRSSEPAYSLRFFLDNKQPDLFAITDSLKPSKLDKLIGGNSITLKFKGVMLKEGYPVLLLRIKDMGGNSWVKAIKVEPSVGVTVEEILPPPNVGKKCDDCAAIIIANQDYLKGIDVAYAISDGNAFKEYAIKFLGIPPTRVFLYQNQTAITMKESLEEFANRVKGSSRIYLFYSGHGFSNSDGEPVLIPIDVDPNAPNNFAISLRTVLDILSRAQADEYLLFIDACYSGLGREAEQVFVSRGAPIEIVMDPLETKATQMNAVIFSAAQGNQRAWALEEAGFGAFTYCLLKTWKTQPVNMQLGEMFQSVKQCLEEEVPAISGQPQRKQTPDAFPYTGKWRNWHLHKY